MATVTKLNVEPRNGVSTRAYPTRADVDAVGLAAALRAEISGEVRFDDGSRALYATDGSNYRQVPIGVVIPRDIEDVVRTVAASRRYGAPILARGGGTSLAGQCCNVAVVMDMSKYVNKIVELNPDGKWARVQPGLVLDELRDAAKPYDLTFAPDPSTHNHCTLGGMIGNNSCGVHSVYGGNTVDNIEELEVLTYDGLRLRVGQTTDEQLEGIIREGGRRGEIYAGLKSLRDRYADLIRSRFPKLPRRVSGYNLDQLLPENGFHVARALVGTECTCVLVLEAKTRLVYRHPARALLLLGYPDVFSAGDHVPEVLTHGPIALEGMDDRLLANIRGRRGHASDLDVLPGGGGWLLAEFGGKDEQEAGDRARAAMEALQKNGELLTLKVLDVAADEELIWKARERGLGATANVPGADLTWEGWEDSAVPVEQLGDYLRGLRKLLNRYGYIGDLYGHFGQGCVHTRIDFDLETRDGIKNFRAFAEDATDLVVSHGGSLSGEHGDGQSRAELLPKMFGDELVEAFGEFKAIWDPDGKMNPGKVVNPYRLDENLRLGTTFNPAPVTTHFAFVEDQGNFTNTALRCVGIGECRKLDGGTMCPSYMVTREERHSTRGRARLLFEMLLRGPLGGGWRDESVKEALDLCLACKGCKSECPVNVDMASYKAEFLSHYYAGRLRPRSAYAFGLIMYAARVASLLPGAVNFLTQTPLLRDMVKMASGMPRERDIPAFAARTFKTWFRQRGVRHEGRPEVILWPDTFNNYFHPETAIAAVEVLEAAGYRVVVPSQALCCGRPLYDYGMLTLAKRQLRQILDVLGPQISAGVPVVGLEPSCVAVFRDELLNLFPHEENAKRLSRQTFALSEFLQKVGYEPWKLYRKAVVQGHCHHKAIVGMESEAAMLTGLGLDAEILDAGCCGMAGSFGFEQEHYEVSMKVGERALLPAVRAAAKDTLIIADGFSCREQIAQGTDRRALHLAQVLQLSRREAGADPVREYPEAHLPEVDEIGVDGAGPAWRTPAAIGAGALLAGGAVLWGRARAGRRPR